jgi:general secretion pathway protein C
MAISAFLLRLRDMDRDEVLRLGAERGPMLASTVLVVLIAAVFAANVLKLLSPPSVPGSSQDISTPRSEPAIDIGAIINAHLFGAAEPVAGDPSSAPATSMSLFLAGTIAGPDPESGWAIIGENAQSARVIRAGAQLPGGAVLKGVYADRVVLELGGRLESLMLPRLAGGAGSYPMRSMSADAGSMIDAVRSAIGGPQAAMAAQEVVRPQPVFENGGLRGVRAYPGRNRIVFRKLGLMPGDLVTAINGARIDDVSRATSALRNLGGEPVQLTVERNGQARQITVDPAAVAQDLAPAESGANSNESNEGTSVDEP